MRSRARSLPPWTCLLLALCPPAARAAVAQNEARAQEEPIAWWREARFDLFVHAALYALPAAEGDGAAVHVQHTARIPVEREPGAPAAAAPRHAR